MLGFDETAIGRDAQGGNLHKRVDAGIDASRCQGHRRGNMNCCKGLPATLAQDAGGIHDSIDIGKDRSPILRTRHEGQIDPALVAASARMAHAGNDPPTAGAQCGGDEATKEPLRADEQCAARRGGIIAVGGGHRGKSGARLQVAQWWHAVGMTAAPTQSNARSSSRAMCRTSRVA